MKTKQIIIFIGMVLLLSVICNAEEYRKPDYEGNGTSSLKPFRIDSAFTIHWKAEGNFFQIYMYESGSKLPYVMANQSPAGDGKSWHGESGVYQMKVNAGGRWRIWIVKD